MTGTTLQNRNIAAPEPTPPTACSPTNNLQAAPEPGLVLVYSPRQTRMALSAHFKLVAMWALLAALLVASVRADGGAPTTTAAAGARLCALPRRAACWCVV